MGPERVTLNVLTLYVWDIPLCVEGSIHIFICTLDANGFITSQVMHLNIGSEQFVLSAFGLLSVLASEGRSLSGVFFLKAT